MHLYLEFDAIVRQFSATKICYAVVGGLALGLHGFLRATEDMDFLVHPDDMDQATGILKQLGYTQSAEPWTFKNSELTLWRFLKVIEDTEDTHIVDLLTPENTEELAILERAKEVPYSEITLKVATKDDLVQMKMRRGSKTDKADIERLENSDEKL